MSDDEDRSKSQADQRTLIALLLMVFVSLLLLGLTALVMPALLGVVLVIGGMLLFGSTHYLLWGWWLPRYLNRHPDPDSDDKKIN
jgi:CHASE2 domain-containing sensor protein